ncbi:MAG: hypothetical protein ACE148_09370 [Vicinamibacterales bacterium]
MKLISGARLAMLLASLVWSAPCAAQQPPPGSGDLQKQIEALKAQVEAMRKDLDEIKDLLAPLRAQMPPRPETIALDLGDRPTRGDPAARLVLVEFTDYQ